MSTTKTDSTAKEKAAVQSSERKTLDLALSAINKQYGDGTLMRMGDATKMQVSTVSTGSVAIDLALGVGGLPRGRIIEIFGPESSGKTTLCLSIIAEVQRQGGNAVFVDVEHIRIKTDILLEIPFLCRQFFNKGLIGSSKHFRAGFIGTFFNYLSTQIKLKLKSEVET
jgi:predicted ATP-dependent serine protease